MSFMEVQEFGILDKVLVYFFQDGEDEFMLVQKEFVEVVLVVEFVLVSI